MEIQKPNTTYKTARYGCCTFSLILDKRHPKKGKETFPVAMRYTINRKSWYNYVEGEYTEDGSYEEGEYAEGEYAEGEYADEYADEK